ncbi:hypothetical protein [Cytobacillus oceanisediminis]|uniref:hypothetical protein n=1 Tax=Cytobacillus oceanisediminis TaxID=665099 RepID=UPI00203B4245|nr:hypothetical protein [Cytobacillus oceanisediminis]MCM3393255.1 hypothetical protein [Cytobacillus oceanisediminis]
MKKFLLSSGLLIMLSSSITTGAFAEGGSYTPEPLKKTEEIGTLATCSPLYTWDLVWNWSRDWTAKSTSYKNCSGTVTRDAIKEISAKVRIYRNGALNNSKTDTQKSTSYAGVRATSTGSSTSGTWEAYGTHIFKKTGYADHSFETYDKE